MVPFSQQGPPQATIEAATLKYVHSPVAETTRFVSFSFVGGMKSMFCNYSINTQNRYRAATGRPTHRYLYGGNFSNISPLYVHQPL